METNNEPRKKPLIVLSSIQPDFSYTVERVLNANNFDVYTQSCQNFNIQKFESLNADLLLVDCEKERKTCLSAVSKIREADKAIPIVLITDKIEDDVLLEAYEAGIDSFLFQPVSMRVLVAHIKAVIDKRVGRYPAGHTTIGAFTLDASSCTLYLGDTSIRLPYMQCCLLEILIRNKNKVCETEQLIKLLWGEESEVRTASNLNIYIYNLRQVLKQDPSIQLINIRGIGFKLTETSSTPSCK